MTRPGEDVVDMTTPWMRLDGNYACPSGVDKLWGLELTFDESVAVGAVSGYDRDLSKD